jgi:hypothetical protein
MGYRYLHCLSIFQHTLAFTTLLQDSIVEKIEDKTSNEKPKRNATFLRDNKHLAICEYLDMPINSLLAVNILTCILLDLMWEV